MSIRRITIVFIICVLAYAAYVNAEHAPAPAAQLHAQAMPA